MKKAFVEQIAGNDGLVERPKNVLQGRIAGFPVNVMQGVDGTAFWRIVIDAKQGTSAPLYPMDGFLAELKGNIKKVGKTSYDGKRMEINLMNSGKAGAQVREILDRAAAYLIQNGFVPCCGCCGEEAPVSLASINGYMDFVCDSCYDGIVNSLEENKQNLKAKKGNMVTGIVGALLGALIGGILWVLIYQLGYIAGLAGLVAAVCALKGYEKFGGKINVAGITVSLVIVAVVIYFAHNIGVSIEVYKAYKEYFDITFFDAYRALPELMKEIPELSSVYWRDLLVGYALTAVAGFTTVRTMLFNSIGSYKTGRY